MKKFLTIILAALLLMPVTSAFANPNAASNTDYVYLIPQEDGTVLYISKFMGINEAGVVFDIPANATNIQAISGCELKDGKILSLTPNETGKIEYHFNLKLSKGEFNYVTPVENTSLTFLTPVGKGLLTSTDVDLETDTSGAGDFNMDGLNDYFFATLIAEANKPVKFIYDQSAKAPGTTGSNQTTEQNNKQEKDTKVTPADENNTTLFIIVGTVAVLVIAGLGLYIYFHNQNTNAKNSNSTIKGEEDEFVKLAQKRKNILNKISELQSNLESGLISEEEQAEKEKVLREKLMKVTVQIKEFTE